MREARVTGSAARLVLFGCALAAGCATAPAGADSHGVAGAYEGRVSVQGQPFSLTVTLRASGARSVRGAVRLGEPIDLEGEVDGVVMDDLLRLEIRYRGADGCDGSIAGILDVTRRGDALDGPVTLRDCGPPVAGDMVLRRRVR